LNLTPNNPQLLTTTKLSPLNNYFLHLAAADIAMDANYISGTSHNQEIGRQRNLPKYSRISIRFQTLKPGQAGF